MSYPPGYPQGQYAAYPGYGQTPQTHMYQAQHAQFQPQHPMVVIPTQPRREVANFQASPQLQPPQFQPNFYQEPPARYHQANHQQYYSSQPPQQQQPRNQYPPPARSYPQQQQQFADQSYYQPPRPQPVYQPPVHQPNPNRLSQGSPQVPYQQQARLPNQSVSPQFHPQALPSQSSSPPLPYGSQQYVNPQALVNPPRQQPHVQKPRVQQRSHQPAQILSSPDPLQQSPPPSRVVAREEIPIQKSSAMEKKSEMHHPPKRRRSNDGQTIPLCETNVPAKRSVSHQYPQAPISSSPLTELNSSQMPPTPVLPPPRAEYQPMLLALADEYVSAAYSMSSTVASDDQRDEYHQLISMGMACLHSLITNYRQSDARREARIRLRLASLMIDETNNDEQIEEILSRGVSLCERSRLVDLKYAMQHLSVRLMFRRSPKAALKSTDNLVQEVETLRLQHWLYTFRLLRVSLSLQSGSHADLTAALRHLNAVSSQADDQRNAAVSIVAATLEAILHLRAGSSDVVDLTQRAMAAARSHQLGPEMQSMPQIRGLLDCLDLMCALIQFNPKQAEVKMQQMQANLDKGTRDAGWSKNGGFDVQLCPTDNEDLDHDTNGILSIKNGNACLAMKWITGGQLYALGFLLSGLAKLLQKGSDGKVEEFLSEGLKMTRATSSVRQSLAACNASAEQDEAFGIAIRLYLVFSRCGHGDWQSARAAIRETRKQFASEGQEVDEPTQRMLLYLNGMCMQGLGELKQALQLYESPLLVPQLDAKASIIEKDLRALATLNRIFILRSFDADAAAQAESLFAAIEPYCRNHPNELFTATCNVVKATAQDATIIKTKQYLQSAIQVAKTTSNLLLAVVMNIMTDNYFRDSIVGDQAERAANASVQLAKVAKSRLWIAVADGMYGDIMERCGKTVEAEAARREAQKLYPELPEALRESVQ